MSAAETLNAAAARVDQAAAWAVRLTDGEIAPEQQAEFAAWLAADPANGKALEEIVGAWHAVERYAANDRVMLLREAALATGRRAMRRGRGHPRRRLGLGLLAASLVIAAGGGGLYAWLSPRTYETGVGERRLVALSDGSKVSLDAATVVRVAYSGENRRLWLDRGRAKFDVAKDPLRPFSVTAADKVVVATGTAFSVELVRQEVRVVLYEGRVALLQRTGSKAAAGRLAPTERLPAEHLLEPGREVTLPEKTVSASQAAVAAPIVASVDPVRSLSWEAGLLVFENEPLSVVVERMNRYARRQLVLGDPTVGGVHVSGVFRAGDTEALTQGLSAAFNVRSRVEGDSVRLFSNRYAGNDTTP